MSPARTSRDGTVPLADASLAEGDEKILFRRMGMPEGPRPRFQRDVSSRNEGFPGRLDQAVDARGAVNIFSGPLRDGWNPPGRTTTLWVFTGSAAFCFSGQSAQRKEAGQQEQRHVFHVCSFCQWMYEEMVFFSIVST